MADNLREASLIGRLADIVKAQYRQKDFYGPDVTALDVGFLHVQAHQLIKQTRNPHILLVMRGKFRAAAHTIMLQNFGCRVTACCTGREAYSRHLKRNPDRFDIAIVDWDMPDINGRDMVHYCRGAGSSLCFLALISSEGLPGMAIRGGANIFLRTPLVIHMHVIRKLLLPPEITATGFPTHVLVSRSHYNEMAHVLGSIRSNSDEDVQMLIAEAVSQIREDLGAEDHDLVDVLIANLKRVLSKTTTALVSASDKQVSRLHTLIREALRIIRDGKISRLQPVKVSQDDVSVENWDVLSKAEQKKCLVAIVAQRDRFRINCETLATTNKAIDDALAKLEPDDLRAAEQPVLRAETDRIAIPTITSQPEVHNVASTQRHTSPGPASPQRTTSVLSPKMSRARFMSVADLRASIQKKPKPESSRPLNVVSERLEMALMMREDTFSAFRPSVESVPFAIPWNLTRVVPLQDVYDPVARVLEQMTTALNSLFSRLLASYPRCRSKLVDFTKEAQSMFTNLPPASIFVRPATTTAGPGEHTELKSTNQQMLVNLKAKVVSSNARLAFGLFSGVRRCRLTQYFHLWKLFRVMRRGFVSSVEEERLMRRTRTNKEILDARSRADRCERELNHANAVIKELKAQLDAAWQPPPAPQLAADRPTTQDKACQVAAIEPLGVLTSTKVTAVPAEVKSPAKIEGQEVTVPRPTTSTVTPLVPKRRSSVSERTATEVNVQPPAAFQMRTVEPERKEDRRSKRDALKTKSKQNQSRSEANADAESEAKVSEEKIKSSTLIREPSGSQASKNSSRVERGRVSFSDEGMKQLQMTTQESTNRWKIEEEASFDALSILTLASADLRRLVHMKNEDLSEQTKETFANQLEQHLFDESTSELPHREPNTGTSTSFRSVSRTATETQNPDHLPESDAHSHIKAPNGVLLPTESEAAAVLHSVEIVVCAAGVDDQSAAPLISETPPSRALLGGPSVLTAECILAKHTPSSESLNPFLLPRREPTPDVDELLNSETMELRPSNGERSILENSQLAGLLPFILPKNLVAINAATPREPEVFREAPKPLPDRAPLPPLNSRTTFSPRTAQYSTSDVRDSLKSLLMSQSARGDAPVATNSTPSSGTARAVDAKKLFVKLGIGKMPKVSPKPQLPSDFALTGRR